MCRRARLAPCAPSPQPPGWPGWRCGPSSTTGRVNDVHSDEIIHAKILQNLRLRCEGSALFISAHVCPSRHRHYLHSKGVRVPWRNATFPTWDRNRCVEQIPFSVCECAFTACTIHAWMIINYLGKHIHMHAHKASSLALLLESIVINNNVCMHALTFALFNSINFKMLKISDLNRSEAGWFCLKRCLSRSAASIPITSNLEL